MKERLLWYVCTFIPTLFVLQMASLEKLLPDVLPRTVAIILVACKTVSPAANHSSHCCANYFPMYLQALAITALVTMSLLLSWGPFESDGKSLNRNRNNCFMQSTEPSH